MEILIVKRNFKRNLKRNFLSYYIKHFANLFDCYESVDFIMSHFSYIETTSSIEITGSGVHVRSSRSPGVTYRNLQLKRVTVAQAKKFLTASLRFLFFSFFTR